MRNAGLEEAQAEISITGNNKLPGEISITSDMQMTPPKYGKFNQGWQKVKRNSKAS